MLNPTTTQSNEPGQIAKSQRAFAKFAYFTVGYNVLVILWGVFLRASHSGDGCGQHWVTCQGEVIPSAPELKTLIEFSHRVTTVIAGFVVIALVVWAIRAFPKRHPVRLAAFLSLVLIVVEGLIGRGLVLTGNTAGNWTPTRPYWAAGHLINTFALLAVLTLTAWFARDRQVPKRFLSVNLKLLLAIAAIGILLVGISGSMAALTNMLFPSATIAEGIAKDFAPDSHWLLRLRISHPLLAVSVGIYLIFIADLLKRKLASAAVARWANVLSILFIAQAIFGAVTLLTLAPIVMQLGHLFLADAVWIAFVVLAASAFGTEPRQTKV